MLSKKKIALAALLMAVILLPASGAQAQTGVCGQWEVVSTPYVPTGSYGDSQFRDITVILSNDAWAVGEIYIGGPTWDTYALAMHWNGAEWSVVPTPSPSTSISALETVAAVSSNDIWAAGVKEIFNPFRELRPFLIHWNGTSWEEVVDSALDLWGGNIYTIEIVGPNDIWFGGEATGSLAVHYDGSNFEVTPTPSFDTGSCSGSYGCGHSIEDMAAVATNDVWAVGGAGDSDYSYVSQIIHWDGTEWTHMPGPSISYFQRLNGVAALASDDVWAVGNLTAADPTDNSILIVHWDGAQWTRVETPLLTIPFGDLQDIVAFAPNDIWAAGIYTETPPPAPGLPLTLHYDGLNWVQVMPDPNGPAGAWLRGLAAADSCDIWAVGSSLETPHVQHLFGDPVVTPQIDRSPRGQIRFVDPLQ